jgi:2-polyprenyl-3-methyl-5-hydroxy-6-metoxy-1,4-benzoquinol methylase
MASIAAQKWDKRFAGADSAPKAAKVLQDHMAFLPKHGNALDVACGLGGNALQLASRGLNTSAWDISAMGLAKLQHFAGEQGLGINTQHIDLEVDNFPAQQFDVITVSHYLHRPLFPALVSALNQAGVIFYQTFTSTNAGKGGPSNPAFLLSDNELLEAFSNLETLFYQQTNSPNMAYYIGRKLT